MDTSNPLPVVQTTSPSLPAAQPPSLQPGLVASASIQSPAVFAMPLQQSNTQQSLFLQQYALSQQTLSKAVKSPAEIAAARAAEISKQLEGASKKKISERSKSRSSSKSLSRSDSESKSKSRSPSRSPIKRRRRRSRSLSPIRYRRDYYPSYRPRDHYGYRGQNYRSYYRGSYNDYSRYRYSRDYDCHYRRRSRSRGRRWSRTRSRSPRRDRSSRSPRRDRSRGRRRSPTLSPPSEKRSQTGSPTDSRRGSVSPPMKAARSRSRPTSLQSLSREARRSRSVVSGSVTVSPASSSSKSEIQENPVSNHIQEKSPLPESSEETDRNQNVVSLKRTKKGMSATCQGGTESSSSPSRSPSVSLDSDRYMNASNKATFKEKQGGSLDDHNGAPNSPGKKFASETEDSEVRKNYSGHGCRGRKQTRSSNSISDDEGQSEESLDDWRHDLKEVVKGKTTTAKEDNTNLFEGQAKSKLSETRLTERGSSLTVDANDLDLKEELVVHGSSFVEHDKLGMVVGVLHAVSDEGNEKVVIGEDKSLEQVAIPEGQTVAPDGDDDSENLVAENLVFEGPQPAHVAHEERKDKGLNLYAQVVDADVKKWHSFIPDDKKVVEMTIAEDKDGHVRHLDGQICSYEDKVRDRSRSRDSKKRGAGLTKHDSRKNKYRRHRKRHKHDSTDEDSERPRKRHKRKHRQGGDHAHKERKKRRHKYRCRSSSIDESSSEGKFEVHNSSGKRRKSSKKRKAKRDLSNSFTSSASLG